MIKKIISIITASSFIITILCGNLQAAPQTDDIKQQQDNYFQNQSMAIVKGIKPIISDTFGKVSDVTDNGSKTIVINIQDLHCDYIVQKNISSIISELKKKYNVSKVYLEGGYGTLDFSLFDNIKDGYKETVLDKLLKSGRLTGAEYYGIKNKDTAILAGVEDKGIYEANIKRLKDILANKQKNEDILKNIKKETENLEAKYLGSKNKELNKVIEKYNKKKISQKEYFGKLLSYADKCGVRISNYPNIAAYLGIQADKINYEKVKAELTAALTEIKKNISYEQYKNILKETDNLKDIFVLKDIIEGYLESKNQNMAKIYPDLMKYYVLKEKTESFNPGQLVKEEENIIDRIRLSISGDKSEAEAAYIVGFEKYFKGYITGSLTAAQWEYVKTGKEKYIELYGKYSIKNDIAKISDEFALLDKFYEQNDKRNEIFVKNIAISKAGSNNAAETNNTAENIIKGAEKVIVLVSGGYHTAGIKEILNKKGISNITIMPSVSGTDVNDSKNKYEILARQQQIYGEKIALGLMTNATAREQIEAIASAMFGANNIDGIKISAFVSQLNDLFAKGIKVKNDMATGELIFEWEEDGKKLSERISVSEIVNKEAESQNIEEMPAAELREVKGEELEEIKNLVYKTTFGAGREIFAPQIYEISKEVCLFMVNNKWYLGNGAIWDIANSEYAGKSLDGIDAQVYEYMPGAMQKALLEKEQDKTKKRSPQDIVKSAAGTVKNILVPIILAVMLLFTTACGNINLKNDYYSVPVVSSQMLSEVQGNTNTALRNFSISDDRYLSFLYDYMSSENKAALTEDQKNVIANLQNLYDQSLVAMFYLDTGDIAKAEAVLSAIEAGDLCKSNVEWTKVTGEITWVGIAVMQYKLITGSDKYDELLKRVDNYLKTRETDFGYYYGSETEIWASTEHQLDIIAYYNLKLVFDRNDEVSKDKLLKACNALYNFYYISAGDLFFRGKEDKYFVTDTSAWALQVILAVDKDIYKESKLSKIDLIGIAEKMEKAYAVDVVSPKNNNYHLYRFAYEDGSPVSFEWSFEVAIAYKKLSYKLEDMAKNASDEQEKSEYSHEAKEYYEKAEQIVKDLKAYAADLGIPEGYFPYADQNNVKNYSQYGWDVFIVPSLCINMQEWQYYNGDHFTPKAHSETSYGKPSAILPDTLAAINRQIDKKTFSIKNALKEIVKKETFISMLLPFSFIQGHSFKNTRKGSKMLVVLSTVADLLLTAVAVTFGICTMPLPFVFLFMTSISLFSNVSLHVLIDYFYLKSTNIEEAVRIFGAAVQLGSDGRLLKMGIQKSIPVFVINDKPDNSLDYDFKPIHTKFKTPDGKTEKGWLGRYKGIPVVYVESVNYEQIVSGFNHSKSLNLLTGTLSENIDVIEVDMESKDNAVRYSESGNPLVSFNTMTTENVFDIAKEISVIKNTRVEAVTILQNIALYMNEPAETVTGSDSIKKLISSYIKGEDFGAEIKIMFDEKYIKKIIEQIKAEVTKEGMSQKEIDMAVRKKMTELMKSFRDENKEIVIVYENGKSGNISDYKDYGIFSYVLNGKYVNTVSDTESSVKMVKDLSSVDGFDGSISVIVVSEFKKELDKATGLFTFLTNALNIKKIIENRNIELVKQVVANFDFDQIPNIEPNIVLSLLATKRYGYEEIVQYLNPSDSITVYYNGLKSVEERNVFMKGILKRIFTVTSLREKGIDTGFKNHNLEALYGQALYIAKKNGLDLTKIKTEFVINSKATAAQVEAEFMKKISELSMQMKEGKPEAIAGILELIPLYADRNTEFRTDSIQTIDIENIRGILSAA